MVYPSNSRAKDAARNCNHFDERRIMYSVCSTFDGENSATTFQPKCS